MNEWTCGESRKERIIFALEIADRVLDKYGSSIKAIGV